MKSFFRHMKPLKFCRQHGTLSVTIIFSFFSLITLFGIFFNLQIPSFFTTENILFVLMLLFLMNFVCILDSIMQLRILRNLNKYFVFPNCLRIWNRVKLLLLHLVVPCMFHGITLHSIFSWIREKSTLSVRSYLTLGTHTHVLLSHSSRFPLRHFKNVVLQCHSVDTTDRIGSQSER